MAFGLGQGSCRFRIVNRRDATFVLVIEPWANEYPFPPGKTYELVVEGDVKKPFEVEWYEDRVVVYSIDTKGAMVRIFEDGREIS
jgi:hypothetical protein